MSVDHTARKSIIIIIFYLAIAMIIWYLLGPGIDFALEHPEQIGFVIALEMLGVIGIIFCLQRFTTTRGNDV